MRMAIVSTGANSLHGVAIKAITGGKYNHTLVRFWEDEEPGEYYESYWKKWEKTGRTGVRGPIPYQKLLDWEQKKKSHKVLCQELPYPEQLIHIAYEFCRERVGKIGYTKPQLLQNAKFNLFGLGTPRWLLSPNKYTCVELAARMWDNMDPGVPGYPGPMRRYLGIGSTRLFDQLAPSGRHGLMEAVTAFLAEVGNQPVGEET